MIVIWVLFGLWLVFTLLDITISGLVLHFGGTREVGLLFVISQDFQLACIIKGIGAFLFGILLVAYKQKGLLAIACALYALLCMWNGMVLLKSMGVG